MPKLTYETHSRLTSSQLRAREAARYAEAPMPRPQAMGGSPDDDTMEELLAQIDTELANSEKLQRGLGSHSGIEVAD